MDLEERHSEMGKGLQNKIKEENKDIFLETWGNAEPRPEAEGSRETSHQYLLLKTEVFSPDHTS